MVFGIETETGFEFVFIVDIRSELHSGDNCVGWVADTGVGCKINKQIFCKLLTRSRLIPVVDIKVDADTGTELTVEGETESLGVFDKSLDGLESDDEPLGEDMIFGFETWSGTLFAVIEVGFEPYDKLDNE